MLAPGKTEYDRQGKIQDCPNLAVNQRPAVIEVMLDAASPVAT
jgi:hypothetical protein